MVRLGAINAVLRELKEASPDQVRAVLDLGYTRCQIANLLFQIPTQLSSQWPRSEYLGLSWCPSAAQRRPEQK